MKLFEAAREAWRKFGYSFPVHDFYCTLMIIMLLDITREDYEKAGFTREIFENAIKEVANYPPAKDMNLLQLMRSFFYLAGDYNYEVSKDTFVAILAGLEQAKTSSRENEDDMYKINFLKRKFKISQCRTVSNNKFIPHAYRKTCLGIGLELPDSKRQRQ